MGRPFVRQSSYLPWKGWEWMKQVFSSYSTLGSHGWTIPVLRRSENLFLSSVQRQCQLAMRTKWEPSLVGILPGGSAAKVPELPYLADLTSEKWEALLDDFSIDDDHSSFDDAKLAILATTATSLQPTQPPSSFKVGLKNIPRLQKGDKCAQENFEVLDRLLDAPISWKLTTSRQNPVMVWITRHSIDLMQSFKMLLSWLRRK